MAIAHARYHTMLVSLSCLASMVLGERISTSAAPESSSQPEIAYYNIKAVGGPGNGKYLTVSKGQALYEPNAENPLVEIAIDESSKQAHVSSYSTNGKFIELMDFCPYLRTLMTSPSISARPIF